MTMTIFLIFLLIILIKIKTTGKKGADDIKDQPKKMQNYRNKWNAVLKEQLTGISINQK